MPYQISQRADYIVNDFFEWVQHNRAIVNTRDEPLADPNQYRRIHLLCGIPIWRNMPTALKMGATGLVLQLIEAGQAPRGLGIDEPVEALQDISHDPDRQWIVRLESGQSISASMCRNSFSLRAAPLQGPGRGNRLGAGAMGSGAERPAWGLCQTGGPNRLGLEVVAIGDLS